MSRMVEYNSYLAPFKLNIIEEALGFTWSAMKFLVCIILCLLFLTACSSKRDNLRIHDRIASEQVRTLKEIQKHSEMILEAHPELSKESKLKVKNYMNETISKQQLLKDEESKIVQLLLSKSLRINQLTNAELKDKQTMKKRLKSVYDLKADNIFSLISHITEMSDNNEINDSFEKDMQLFIRDFR